MDYAHDPLDSTCLCAKNRYKTEDRPLGPTPESWNPPLDMAWMRLYWFCCQVLDEVSPEKRSCLVVDATQSLGVVPIAVKSAGIDWLVPETN